MDFRKYFDYSEKDSYKIVALLTDFGADSHYVGIMKAVIKAIAPYAEIIDLEHNVVPQNIIQSSYILYSSYSYFPHHTVFQIVVDPGVGTERKIIIAKYKTYIFVAPDNGILGFLKNKKSEFFVLNKSIRLPWKLSNTFHGRDIFSPLSAYIINGGEIKEIAEPTSNISIVNWWSPHISGKKIKGMVLHADRFGNIITNITCDRLKSLSYITLDGIKVTQRSETYKTAQEHIPFMLCGSSKLIELSIKNMNFAQKYNIKPEQEVIAYIY